MPRSRSPFAFVAVVRGFVVALALALAACGGSDREVGVAPRVLTSEAAAEREVAVVASIEPRHFDTDVGAGRVEDGVWRPRAGAPDRVAIHGDFDLARANRLRFRAEGLEGAHVRVGVRADGRTVCVTEVAPEDLDGDVVRVDLEACAGVTRADEVVVGVSRHGEGAALGAIEFVRRPAAALVPAPGDGPSPVCTHEETREAYGVTPNAPLSARLRVPAGSAGAASVRFAVANVGDEPASLRCVVRESGGEDVVVEREAAPRSGWDPVRVELTSTAGDAPRFVDVSIQVARGALAVTEPRGVRARADAKTVILITSDTHRGDHLGLLGDVDVDTPHLDALARRGTLFTDARCVAHITNPSHVSVMTGVHVNDHGITDNRTPLSDRAGTLAEAFRSAGWRAVAATSVRHLAPENAGLAQGFDAFVAPAAMGYEGFDAPAHLARLLEECDGRPTFAWLHLFDAHSPYRPPARWIERYAADAGDPYDASLPAPARRVAWDLELRDLRVLPAWYRGEVSALDERLAAVFALPRAADAWIAFTADHGERLDTELGVIEHESLVRDTLHVPLVLAGPGVAVGRRIAAPVSNQDLGRTLLDLAGLHDVDFPGRDVFTVDGEEARFAYARYGRSVCVEHDGWLYVRHLADHDDGAPIVYSAGDEELFDLSRDPACRRDVAAEHPERAADLRARVDEFLSSGRELDWGVPREISGAERARLEALGYAGD